jgi:hydroxymethylbilane synthase
LLARRPDLEILPVRGDVDARVQEVMAGEYDAIVLAQAGLTRLGLQQYISEVFSLDVMLPAPGQGALAVQCRAENEETIRLLHAIHAPAIAAAVAAERSFLASLGIDSSLPVAAYAEYDTDGLILTGAVFSTDGKQSIRLSAVDTDPYRLGERLAGFVLERGAAELFSARITQMGTLYR